MGSELAAGVEGGVDAGVDVVADDGAEFAAAGIDDLSIDCGAMVFAVVAEVGCDGAGAEVDLIGEDTIADVAQVADIGVVAEDGVFEFDGLTNVTVVSDGDGAAEVAVRPDFAVGPDDDEAFDDDAGKDVGVFASNEGGVADEMGRGFAGLVGEGFEKGFVKVEDLPRVLDGIELVLGEVAGGEPFGEGVSADGKGVKGVFEGPELHVFVIHRFG